MMDDEIGRLKEENRRLRELIAQHGIALPPELIAAEHRQVASAGSNLSADAKVRRFRQLFRGRDDVYAVRWADSTFKGVGLNHIALRVADIPRSKKFYQELLGLPFISEPVDE
jgi:hypothetical protein